MRVSDDEFEKLISESMDELPEEYITGLDNVAITFDDEPNPAQRKKLKLRCHQTLFGLFEGVPKTERGAGYAMVLPDKITLFKKPMEHHAQNMVDLKEQVKNTLWHEIAHHYGLNHARIHELEAKMHKYRRNRS